MRELRADDIAGLLKQRAASGEWGADLRLPAERDLATEFGVARNTIRLALRQLEDAGAVVRQVGRGTFLIAEQSPTLAAIIKRMEGGSPADIMETRLLIEPSAAAFAATNSNFAELQNVRDAHEQVVHVNDVHTFEEWDAEFHRRVFACCGNDFLRGINELIGKVRSQPLWFSIKARVFSEDRLQSCRQEHSLIVEHLLSRDANGARQAMLEHLQVVKQNLLGR